MSITNNAFVMRPFWSPQSHHDRRDPAPTRTDPVTTRRAPTQYLIRERDSCWDNTMLCQESISPMTYAPGETSGPKDSSDRRSGGKSRPELKLARPEPELVPGLPRASRAPDRAAVHRATRAPDSRPKRGLRGWGALGSGKSARGRAHGVRQAESGTGPGPRAALPARARAVRRRLVARGWQPAVRALACGWGPAAGNLRFARWPAVGGPRLACGWWPAAGNLRFARWPAVGGPAGGNVRSGVGLRLVARDRRSSVSIMRFAPWSGVRLAICGSRAGLRYAP